MTDQYISTPRSIDPVELLAEERLRSAWLRQLLAERDAEVVDRERQVNALLIELIDAR